MDEHALSAMEEGLARGPLDMAQKRAVALVLTRIQSCMPTAVIRFGEGEGRVLAAERQDRESIKVAANKLKRQTGRVYGSDDVLRIKSLLMRAFDRADVVGLRGSPSFSQEHDMWVKRLEAMFAGRVAAGREPAVVTHCLVNNELHNNLATLLAEQDLLSVVSCRDLASRLSETYRVKDVASYQVPSQYIMRQVDEGYEARLHDEDFWPDFYFDLRRRLTVREPGEVFLVGAGILGKELCIRIRELGGIALDMGSCLDAVASKVTRGAGKPEPYRPPQKTRFLRLPRKRSS